ncbi:MAG: hypothetical protein EOP62_09350 [Sphingomonadales bacterium]|nr:MAG: hypothetical protein EOP62_09350 [Sphingomonadales bacterium]
MSEATIALVSIWTSTERLVAVPAIPASACIAPAMLAGAAIPEPPQTTELLTTRLGWRAGDLIVETIKRA